MTDSMTVTADIHLCWWIENFQEASHSPCWRWENSALPQEFLTLWLLKKITVLRCCTKKKSIAEHNLTHKQPLKRRNNSKLYCCIGHIVQGGLLTLFYWRCIQVGGWVCCCGWWRGSCYRVDWHCASLRRWHTRGVRGTSADATLSRGTRTVCWKEDIKLNQQFYSLDSVHDMRFTAQDLPPLTIDDQVPPDGLPRAGGGAEPSAAPWDMKSPARGPAPRHEVTLWSLGVRCDLGDIRGGPTFTERGDFLLS